MGERAYYNDTDPDAAAVLEQQIAEGVIAPGIVDTRSIKDVQPHDLVGFTQCHFFAGGGLWSVAARLAGWPDERPLWTGSCPCQPFSPAGKGLGTDDARHLWPDFHRLIRAGRPPVVMGEQVAGSAGYGWFDGVGADLASEGYTSRAVDIPACAIDAPHQRNRLYWVAMADADSSRRTGRTENAQWRSFKRDAAERPTRELVDATGIGRREGRTEHVVLGGRSTAASADASGDLAHGARLGRQVPASGAEPAVQRAIGGFDPLQRNGSFWADAEWITCHDGKARRTKPGLRLLVDGLPGRVGLWRVAGNAISPVLAAEVIAAYLDAERIAA